MVTPPSMAAKAKSTKESEGEHGMRKVFLIGLPVVALALGLLFAGCDSGDSVPDLPISTIEFGKGADGFTQFYTNDLQYYNYSFWEIYDHNGDTYEIECKKQSGSKDFAYGLIFGASDTGTRQFYSLWISCNNSYSINKFTAEKFSQISDWKKTDKLYSGYDKINKLKVVKSGSTYTIFLNDDQVDKFTDSAGFGNRIGFFASVGKETDEKFPNSPVDVRFMLK